MSNGGYKGASPARETSPEQYPGVWELTEQFQAQADGNWPFQADDNAPKSLRFNSADSSFASRTPVVASNRRTFTWSGWVKRSKLDGEGFISVGTAGQQIFIAGFTGGDDKFYIHNGVQGVSTASWCVTSAVFRDTSSWYHAVSYTHLTLPTTERV